MLRKQQSLVNRAHLLHVYQVKIMQKDNFLISHRTAQQQDEIIIVKAIYFSCREIMFSTVSGKLCFTLPLQLYGAG